MDGQVAFTNLLRCSHHCPVCRALTLTRLMLTALTLISIIMRSLMILFPVTHRFGGGHAGCVGLPQRPGRRRDTGRMVDDTARDRAICHALTVADECLHDWPCPRRPRWECRLCRRPVRQPLTVTGDERDHVVRRAGGAARRGPGGHPRGVAGETGRAPAGHAGGGAARSDVGGGPGAAGGDGGVGRAGRPCRRAPYDEQIGFVRPGRAWRRPGGGRRADVSLGQGWSTADEESLEPYSDPHPRVAVPDVTGCSTARAWRWPAGSACAWPRSG